MKTPACQSLNQGENSPTFWEIRRETLRLQGLYQKRHSKRAGRKPSENSFIEMAALNLLDLENAGGRSLASKDLLEQLATALRPFFPNKEYCEENLGAIRRRLRSQALKETAWENTWAWLRMGQKVWRFIEKNGPTSPREIQQRFKITAEELEHLPCPTAAAFMNTKRPKKLFVDVELYKSQRPA